MANPCGCKDLSSESTSRMNVSIPITQQDQPEECPAIVHEAVCVQADVTISPNVVVGQIQSFCVGGPKIGVCPGTPSPTQACTFTVSQNICVQVPLTFSATATAAPSGIVCGTPETGPCPGTSGCTFTRGYFLNHPTVTSALIEAAGGSIVLGIDAQGLSFTVTTANASTVLSGNTPLPSGVPPIYENLYAQLLTADLNVLNGATCDFATAAITDANNLLASTSPPDQVAASELVDRLTLFNEGIAPNCPEHCPGS